MIPSRALKANLIPSPWVFQELCGWLVAYISKHRTCDAHAPAYCKGWPTPVALNLADWVCAKRTGDPCMCRWLGLCTYKIQ